MKREQRRPWVILTNNEGYILCSFCRYVRFYEDDLGCEHPLTVVGDINPEPGDDCWGFRPKKGETMETVAAWMKQGVKARG